MLVVSDALDLLALSASLAAFAASFWSMSKPCGGIGPVNPIP